MSYTPPPGGSVTLAFSSSVYTPPPGGSVTLEFELPSGSTIYASSIGDTSALGTPVLEWTQFLDLNYSSYGIAPGIPGFPGVDFHRLKPGGFSDEAFGALYIYLAQRWVLPGGIDPVLTGEGAGAFPGVIPQREYARYEAAPYGSSVVLEFERRTYNAYPQDGSSVALEFAWPYVKPYGWDDSAFGAVGIAYNSTQTLTLAGFSDEALGTPVATPGPVTIAPTGLAAGAFGTHVIWDYYSYIVPTGLAAGGVGAATVVNLDRFLTLTGIAPKGFGTTAIVNLNRGINVPVWDASAFGTAWVYTHTQYVFGFGIDSAVYGGLDIDYFDRTRAMVGWNDEGFGTAIIYHHGVYGASAGYFPWWGMAYVSNGLDRTVFPMTINYPSWNIGLSGTAISLYNRALTGKGWDSSAFGKPQMSPIYITPKVKTPPDQEKFGVAWISNWLRYPGPVGWDSSLVWDDYGPIDPLTGRGAGVYRGSDELGVPGFSSAGFGSAGIQLFTNGIEINDSIAPGAVGALRISGANYIEPSGADSMVFGDVDKWEAGKIKPYGPDMSSYGIPRINRATFPAGIAPINMPWPSLGEPLYVSGFDSVGFGDVVLVAPYDCNWRNVANATVGDTSGFGVSANIIGETSTIPPHNIYSAGIHVDFA